MKTIAVIGEGALADLASEQLASSYEVIHAKAAGDGTAGAQIALLLQDGWNASFYRENRKKLGGVPRLYAYMSFGEAVIGPFEEDGWKGCVYCASVRRLMAGRDRKEMWDLTERLDETGSSRDAWATRAAMEQVIHVIGDEIRLSLSGKPVRSEGAVYLMNLKTLSGSWHSFLADPFCKVCGTPEEDSPELARIRLEPSPKISEDSYRCRSMSELSHVLFKDYLDGKTGIFNEKTVDLSTPFADAIINLPLFGGNEGTAGRTLSYEASGMTAILEGLERYCGMLPRGKKPVIRDSYSQLSEYAIDPRTVGVHAPENYEQPGFPFKPFRPDRKMSWVWGYSFLQERPVLVPELLAYYSLGCGHKGGYVYETSNGCAVGGSLEEAVFHGIMEVAERDSFLITWYAKLPLRKVDPRSAGDEELNLMLDRMEFVSGYELHLFRSTMEHGIPSIWTVVKNRNDSGMNVMCAAGAHLDPVKAVKSAVFELAGMMGGLGEKLEHSRERYENMLADGSLVKKMEDHGMLYGLKEAEERLGFLLNDTRPMLTFEEAFGRTPVRSDLKEDLEDVLGRFKERKMDVIVVDQTAPELKRNGLHCVKVLIPGMLPMTFGHHLTRVTGLERVLKVPAELGYYPKPLTMAELNPYPHPFP
ncbi:bacteriocin biosynthesis protein SagD [Bacillus sp. FJAT-42376]|uniref:TOMM precursor leader peptide-binding protein n=1 Tax=Bacillus sp. FJAT-42376 TaxID=2014076 RepID=UPI000F508642|nr:TOMM precursor leader peptide-binding protein [Bacillus sp. FJAT-42376]AZB41818.1 bacteriocin biosynthesis protein SagD [Bacillus sp. FJAT-42376]